MLKYQVRTLNRGDRRNRNRKSAYQFFEEYPEGGMSSPDCLRAPSSGSPEPPPTPALFGTGGGIHHSISSASPSTSSTSSAGGVLCGDYRRGSTTCPLRRKGRSTSVSSLSSTSTNNSEPGVDWGTIRVYTYTLRADSDYKTMFINSSTTAEELLHMVLAKFKSKLKDPKLFYLSMEILTKHEGKTVETVLALEPHSKPMELQHYHPKDQLRFVLQIRKGVQVRVHDSHISPESNYKSLLISEMTTAEEVVEIMCQCHKYNWPPSALELFIVDTQSGYEYSLIPQDPLPAVTAQPWFDSETHQIHVRPCYKRDSGPNGILTIPVNYSSLESLSGQRSLYPGRRDLFMDTFSKTFDKYCGLGI